jgi:hypothetical protein
MQKNIAKLTEVGKLVEALSQNGNIHFRVYYEADSSEVDLLHIGG